MKTMRVSRRSSGRSGMALALVLGLVLVLGIVAGALSLQTSGLRRTQARAELSGQACEVAQSAIDEVAAKLAIADVFDAGTFGPIEDFLTKVRDNSSIAAGSVEWRQIRYESGKSEQLFSALTFPLRITSIAPATTQSLFGGKDAIQSIGPVLVRPLRFRREHYINGSRWVNWGIVQLSCTVEAGAGSTKVTREVTADRLFKLQASMDASTSLIDWHLVVSGTNQRTLVRGDSAARPAAGRQA